MTPTNEKKGNKEKGGGGMIVYKISPFADYSDALIVKTNQEVMDFIDTYIDDDFDSLHIQQTSMTEEEFKKLPEHEGF